MCLRYAKGLLNLFGNSRRLKEQISEAVCGGGADKAGHKPQTAGEHGCGSVHFWGQLLMQESLRHPYISLISRWLLLVTNSRKLRYPFHSAFLHFIDLSQKWGHSVYFLSYIVNYYLLLVILLEVL